MEHLAPQDPPSIGEYRLLGRLGEGGMGRVYLARSAGGRTVAVKLIKAELAGKPEFRGRFRQEVAAARRVGGEWTAPVLDADTEAAEPWVATGYIAGPSLLHIVRERPLPQESVRTLAYGLAGALRSVHGAGLVHRDLKPSNVLVTIAGPRVIDFGIARALEYASEELTQTGVVVGSPGYMSPEQIQGERVGPACDVFSLGSVLAYAATGRLPFGRSDTGIHSIMFRIVSAEPDLNGVDGELRQLIADCLAKDPAGRPTPEQIVERTRPADPAAPWLPAALIAELGQHAVSLLDADTPTRGAVPTPPSPDAGRVAYGTPPSPGTPGTSGTPGIPGAPGTPGTPGTPNTPGTPRSDATPPWPQASGDPAPAAPGGVPGSPSAAAPYGSWVQGHLAAPDASDTVGTGPEARKRSWRTVVIAGVAVAALLGSAFTAVALLRGDGDTVAGRPGGGVGSSNGAPDAAGRGKDKEWLSSPGPGSGASDDAKEPSSKNPAGKKPGKPGKAGGPAALPAAYAGAWIGSVDRDGADTGSQRRITLSPGKVGDTVVASISVGESYLCKGTGKLLAASGGSIRVDTGVTVSTPAGKCSAIGEQTLTARSDGTLAWTASGGRSATLHKAGSDRIRDGFLGSWERQLTGSAGVQRLTVSQGAVGSQVVTFTTTQDGGTCLSKSELFSAADRVVIGPSLVVSGDCAAAGSSVLTVSGSTLNRSFLDTGNSPREYRRP
ncbi:serine/threonine protein kinase [Streptomyces sp. NBC_01750]|uniref:serine/threonine protein kinase n=1 Tax=Streptomyces sp. NBC_01750 TaxID=2975928 RepID=UPI002DD83DE6|nr:protein kinase [Streptomyces sp. NBC_01750]WSD34345.1 protein kinase [Streptomyces sp. NBC_01750]